MPTRRACAAPRSARSRSPRPGSSCRWTPRSAGSSVPLRLPTAMSLVVTQLPDAERRPRRLAIGSFDGVHVGHRQVIAGADTVLTFEPHPLRGIHPEAAPQLLMPFAMRRDVIEGLGVEELVVIPFDREFSTIEPQEFIVRVLLEALGAERVSVGENFRFGARARGTPEILASR